MITFLNQETTNVVSFRLEGKITAEDIDKIADVLEPRFNSVENINLYIEIADSFEESFGAILEQGKKSFSVFLPNLGKIKKAAIVSDKSWIKKITDFEGMFVSTKMKGFSMNEKDEAFDWVKSF